MDYKEFLAKRKEEIGYADGGYKDVLASKPIYEEDYASRPRNLEDYQIYRSQIQPQLDQIKAKELEQIKKDKLKPVTNTKTMEAWGSATRKNLYDKGLLKYEYIKPEQDTWFKSSMDKSFEDKTRENLYNKGLLPDKYVKLGDSFSNTPIPKSFNDYREQDFSTLSPADKIDFVNSMPAMKIAKAVASSGKETREFGDNLSTLQKKGLKAEYEFGKALAGATATLGNKIGYGVASLGDLTAGNIYRLFDPEGADKTTKTMNDFFAQQGRDINDTFFADKTGVSTPVKAVNEVVKFGGELAPWIVSTPLGLLTSYAGGKERAIDSGMSNTEANLYGGANALKDRILMPLGIKAGKTVGSTLGQIAGISGANALATNTLDVTTDKLRSDNGQNLGANSVGEFGSRLLRDTTINAMTFGLLHAGGKGIQAIKNSNNKPNGGTPRNIDTNEVNPERTTDRVNQEADIVNPKDIPQEPTKATQYKNNMDMAEANFREKAKELEDYSRENNLTDSEYKYLLETELKNEIDEFAFWKDNYERVMTEESMARDNRINEAVGNTKLLAEPNPDSPLTTEDILKNPIPKNNQTIIMGGNVKNIDNVPKYDPTRTTQEIKQLESPTRNPEEDILYNSKNLPEVLNGKVNETAPIKTGNREFQNPKLHTGAEKTDQLADFKKTAFELEQLSKNSKGTTPTKPNEITSLNPLMNKKTSTKKVGAKKTIEPTKVDDGLNELENMAMNKAKADTNGQLELLAQQSKAKKSQKITSKNPLKQEPIVEPVKQVQPKVEEVNQPAQNKESVDLTKLKKFFEDKINKQISKAESSYKKGEISKEEYEYAIDELKAQQLQYNSVIQEEARKYNAKKKAPDGISNAKGFAKRNGKLNDVENEMAMSKLDDLGLWKDDMSLSKPKVETTTTETPITETPKTKPYYTKDEVERGKKYTKFANDTEIKSKSIDEEVKQEIAKNKSLYDSVTNEKDYANAVKRVKNEEDVLGRWKDGEFKGSESTATGIALIKHYQKLGGKENIRQAVEISETLSQRLTEAGKEIQATRILEFLSPEGRLHKAQKESNKMSETYLNENKNRKLKEKVEAEIKDLVDKGMSKTQAKQIVYEKNEVPSLTEQDLQRITSLSEKYQEATTNYDKKAIQSEIQGIIKNKIPPTMVKKLETYRMINMLFNPKTFLRNLVGNTTNAVAGVPRDFVASGIDKLLSKQNGGLRTTGSVNIKTKLKAFKNGLNESVRDSLDGREIKDYYKDTTKVKGTINLLKDMTDPNKGNNTDYHSFEDINTGQRAFGNVRMFKNSPKLRDTKIVKSLNKATENTLGRTEKLMNVGLSGMDRGFRTAEFENSMENLRKLNPTKTDDELIPIALERSKVATFQEDNRLAKGINTVKNYNAATNLLVGSQIPFAKTPSNIAGQMLDYVPIIGTGKAINNYIKMRKSNNPTETAILQNRVARQGGSQAVGGLVTAGGYALGKGVIDGLSVGSGEEQNNNKIRDWNTQTGNQPYGIKIGDKTYSTNEFEPLAGAYRFGVNASNNVGLGENLYDTFSSMRDNSYLQGVSNILDVINSKDIKEVGDGTTSMASSLGSQLLPFNSTLKPLNRAIDPSIKETYDPNFAKQSLNKAISQYPVLSQMLPQKVDMLGNELNYNDDTTKLGGLLRDTVIPVTVKDNKLSEAEKIIQNEYQYSKDKGVLPYKVTGAEAKTWTEDGAKLTTEDLIELQKRIGKGISGSLTYGMTAEEQAKKIKEIKQLELAKFLEQNRSRYKIKSSREEELQKKIRG